MAKDGVHMTERRYGRFYRSIPLPEESKVEGARAKFENGVPEITVPLQQQKKAREIPIEMSSPTGSPAKAA